MVEICVVLSTFLSEEDAFWTFRLLLDVLLPKYHEESVVDFHMDCMVLQDLVSLHDPVLSEHLADIGMTIQLLCTKWLFSFFAESMPFELVCRLYDILLVDICVLKLSSKIVFSTSLAIFLYLSAALVEVHDPSVMMEIIGEFCLSTLGDYSIAESFVDLILFLHSHVEEDEIAALRDKYKKQLMLEQKQRQRRKSMPPQQLQSGQSSSRKRATSAAPLRKLQSIKLLIKWRKPDGEDSCSGIGENGRSHSGVISELEIDQEHDDGASSEDDMAVEIVTTPSEKEMLAKVYEGIYKINRRRSRSSSLRNMSLRGAESATPASGNVRPNLFMNRTLSSSSSILSSRGIPPSPFGDGDYTAFPSERPNDAIDDESDELAMWGRLQISRDHDAIIARSTYGIPDEHRVWVWPILLAQVPPPSNLMQSMLYAENEDQAALLDREIAKSIENDISRTRNLKPEMTKPMRRVLTAFATRNRRVGYCQGMNEILVVLLQYLPEQKALEALVLLIEVLLPSYHVDSMIGLHTDCAVMNTLLLQNDPELHSHLCELGLNMEILCTKWLVTCFLTSLPAFCGLKVIDMLFARASEKQCASRVLLGVGISIFFTLRDVLLEAKDAGEVLLAVNEYFAHENDKTAREMDTFLAFCRSIIDQLEPEIVEECRSVHKDEVMDRFAAFEAKKIEMRQQLEEAKASKAKLQPPSPSRRGTPSPSSSRRGTTDQAPARPPGSGGVKKSGGLSSYISKPLLGKSASTGDSDHRKELMYQRVDVVEANRTFTEDLVKMEEQLDDLADLYLRGKIDEKEHSCIKAQIVRKWCKVVNSPQSAMLRVQAVKAAQNKSKLNPRGSLGGSSTSGTPDRLSQDSNGHHHHPNKKASGSAAVSLYGRMKKARKNAIAIFKSTFE